MNQRGNGIQTEPIWFAGKQTFQKEMGATIDIL